jgi:quinol monooxygenase YgiN
MLILAGSLRIPAGRRDAALLHLQEMADASRAEPGCLAFSFGLDVGDDHLIRIFEVFADREALAAHRNSPHMARFRVVREELGLFDRTMSEYEVSDWRRI